MFSECYLRDAELAPRGGVGGAKGKSVSKHLDRFLVSRKVLQFDGVLIVGSPISITSGDLLLRERGVLSRFLLLSGRRGEVSVVMDDEFGSKVGVSGVGDFLLHRFMNRALESNALVVGKEAEIARSVEADRSAIPRWMVERKWVGRIIELVGVVVTDKRDSLWCIGEEREDRLGSRRIKLFIGIKYENPRLSGELKGTVAGYGEVVGPWNLDDSGPKISGDRHSVIGGAGVGDDNLGC